jgi:hypothetical protein
MDNCWDRVEEDIMGNVIKDVEKGQDIVRVNGCGIRTVLILLVL